MTIPNNLLPSRKQWGGGSAHAEYFIEVERGVTPEHVVDPDFWVHLAPQLKPLDRIEIVAKDGTFDMEVRVVAVDPRGLYAHVRVLLCVPGDGVPIIEVTPAAPPGPPPPGMPDRDGYVVEPDSKGWRVVRGNDLIEGQLPSEAAANAAREAHRAGKPLKKAS